MESQLKEEKWREGTTNKQKLLGKEGRSAQRVL